MKAHTTKQYRTLKGKIENEVKHAQRNPGKFDFDKTVAEIMQAVLIYDFAVKN
jgi:hypothetical protein